MIGTALFLFFLSIWFILLPAFIIYKVYCSVKKSYCKKNDIKYTKPSENARNLFTAVAAALLIGNQE